MSWTPEQRDELFERLKCQPRRLEPPVPMEPRLRFYPGLWSGAPLARLSAPKWHVESDGQRFLSDRPVAIEAVGRATHLHRIALYGLPSPAGALSALVRHASRQMAGGLP